MFEIDCIACEDYPMFMHIELKFILTTTITNTVHYKYNAYNTNCLKKRVKEIQYLSCLPL